MMRWGRQPRPGGQGRISGTVDWQLKSYTVSTTGSHTFKWRYTKDSSGSVGSDSFSHQPPACESRLLIRVLLGLALVAASTCQYQEQHPFLYVSTHSERDQLCFRSPFLCLSVNRPAPQTLRSKRHES